MKILPSSEYLIQPEHIDEKAPFTGAFGSSEAEETARAIVRFAQSEDRWNPFTLVEIRRFLSGLRRLAMTVIRGSLLLKKEGYLEVDEEDKEVYYVTDRFIDRCHSFAPMGKKI